MPRISASVGAFWSPSRPAGPDVGIVVPAAVEGDAEPAGHWGAPVDVERQTGAVFDRAAAADVGASMPWAAFGARLAPASRVLWGLSTQADRTRRFAAQAGLLAPLVVRSKAPWGLSAAADDPRLLMGSDGSVLQSRPLVLRGAWRLAIAAGPRVWVPWGMGRIIDRGTGIVVEPGDPDEPDPNTIIIPTLRAYIVINDASLTRVSNNLALPATGFSISIDSDSAHWTWSASLPLRAKGDLEPNAPDELVELEAMANGAIWRLLVESIREDERFGAGSLRIGGRGIAAVLSDPSAPAVARDNFGAGMTAQQIAMDALSINGTPLGWTLDWQIADWLIPAGVWAHTGTAMEAVVRLAEVAGGYVQAAPATQSLRVMPRYPVAPWEWATAAPAVILPAAAVLERGAQHIVKPAYNAVHVAGQGARGRVVRAGSVGDRPARVIVDDLATHLDAIRGRGISVLGDTGAQQVTTLETGILPASGVIHVGTLMDWTRGAVARRGIVRGLSVTVSVPGLTSNAPLIVRQALEVECHG